MLDVIRAKVAERLPLEKGSLGLRLIFDGLVVMSRVTKGRIDENRGIAQQATRGALGAYNYEFTGEGGGRWWLEIGDATMHWHRGASPNARATVRVPTLEVWRLLAGKTSFITAQMTGKIRVEGDGHAMMMFGGLIARVRSMRELRGRRGRAVRAYLDLAIRQSGTGFVFDGGPK